MFIKSELFQSTILTVESMCKIRANIFSPSTKSMNLSALAVEKVFPTGLMFPKAQHIAAIGTFQNCLTNWRMLLIFIMSRLP